MTINITRDVQKLVYTTLMLELNEALGLPTGSIKIMSPESLFVNERTEETNNLDQSRFPLLSVTPEKGRLYYTQNMPIRQRATYTASGLTDSWLSDMLYEEQMYFCMETTTKRDFRLYRDKMLTFFNQSRNGILIRDDILPEKDEYLTLVLSDTIDYDLLHAPYQSIFNVRTFYRIYQERQRYLFLKMTVSGKIGVDPSKEKNILLWHEP